MTETIIEPKTFRKDLCNLINFHSQENSSDTPDFILAEYLIGCLDAFDRATRDRTKFYGDTIADFNADRTFDPDY